MRYRNLLGMFATVLGLLASHALHAQVDSQGAPTAFVQAITDQALAVVEKNGAIRAGDNAAITDAIHQYILPYVNMEKMTRLAAGRYWREASSTQREQWVAGFTQTLIRTYSSAFTQVAPGTKISILPWRGKPSDTDTAVNSSISRENGAPVAVSYRLEKTDQGWKIYDLNVEGIWLIQNYRNQFAQEISANGIDGLIASLNRQTP